MSEEPGADRAWVRVPAPFPPEDLIAFCADAERLLRINSLYEFQEWRTEGNGRHFMRLKNLASGRTLETALRAEPLPDGLRVAYTTGVKAFTEFRVETAPDGASVLVVTDDYSALPEAERRTRADEIDRSLVPWGNDLLRYFRQRKTWGSFPPYRWYMERVWQGMTPSGRRIAYILIAIGVFELGAGVLALAAYGLGWW